MLKSFFENIPRSSSEDEEQEVRELYEVAANYEDFGVGSAKKPEDAGIELAQVAELARETLEIEPPTGLLDVY